MNAQKPTIGRIVTYRSRTGDYDVPAIVNCTVETLSPRGVELGHVPPLSSPEHVHLTVLTPGKPGKRRGASDFLVESKHGRGENVAGTYQEWDIGPECANCAEAGEPPTPGTWRWPERVPVVPPRGTDEADALYDAVAQARYRDGLDRGLTDAEAREEGWPETEPDRVDTLARAFHETYERLAPEHGYETREASAVPWEDVPAQNKALMRATVAEVFAAAPAPINVRTAILLFLEEYDADIAAQREGEQPKWESHDDGAEALIEHLRARGFEIVEIGGPDSAFAPAPQTEPGIEQARQTAPEGGAR